MSTLLYIMTTPHSGFPQTPIKMTLNDPACPFERKVGFPAGTPEVRNKNIMLWLNDGCSENTYYINA